jgi:hypothetical protein
MVCIILSNEMEAMKEWRKMMMFLPLVFAAARHPLVNINENTSGKLASAERESSGRG